MLKKPNLKQCTFHEFKSWVMVNFLLSTGVRQNSLINIKRKDVDFDNEVVYVNVMKNRKPLIVPLNNDILKILKEYLKYRNHESGEEVTIEQIDRKFNSNKSVIRTEKGEFNLEEQLIDTICVCRDIMKDIENKFGKTVLHDQVSIRGGAERFLKVMDEKIRNNVEVPVEIRWYANCEGYLISNTN